MKKNIKICLAVTLLLFFSCSTIHAEEGTAYATPIFSKYIDNDTIDPDCGNLIVGGTWDYITGSSHYNNDARIALSKTGNLYGWTMHKDGLKSSNPEIKVYINDARFTCPKAQYVYYAYSSSGSQTAYLQVQINQNTAAGGWNYIGTASAGAIGKRVSHVTVTPRETASGYIGADGVNIRLA